MLAAGYVLAERGWGSALAVMLPAGLLISAAFALAEPHVVSHADGRPTRHRLWRLIRLVLVALVGIPWASGRRAISRQLVICGGALCSGTTLVLAGYALAARRWLVVPPFIVAAGAIIAPTLYVNWSSADGVPHGRGNASNR